MFKIDLMLTVLDSDIESGNISTTGTKMEFNIDLLYHMNEHIKGQGKEVISGKCDLESLSDC